MTATTRHDEAESVWRMALAIAALSIGVGCSAAPAPPWRARRASAPPLAPTTARLLLFLTTPRSARAPPATPTRALRLRAWALRRPRRTARPRLPDRCSAAGNATSPFRRARCSWRRRSRAWRRDRGRAPVPPPARRRTIPHPLQLRENCLACHGGPAARAELRTTHPERVRCRQCHVPDVAGP